MRIGLTYDLKSDYVALGMSDEDAAEFDREDTIEAIEGSLRELGHETDRIGHVKSLVGRLSRGDRWDFVFNIAEGVAGFGREAQVPALLEAYDIPYTFSDPLVLTLTLHKGMAKHVIRDSGIPTAPFVVVSEPDDIATVDLPLPLFAKPVAEGTGKGISARSRIETAEDLREVCSQMLREHRQPVLVETFLPGREFTVGIVGNGKDARALGTLEVFLKGGAEPGAYSYHNKKEYETVVEYRLAGDGEALRAMDTALASWKALGCRDGGRVDLRSDGREVPHFVEVNPLAGLHPVHSDLCILAQRVGISYKDLIGGILAAALARYR
ncbi:MAG TPA: hypothetical protein PKY58_12445 [Syntrophales bacterium]|nr:hypothetical protein [Syntrophales bacterium]HPX11668.1 hypothetical protein [Syntrophales bacterium]HQB30716.1 hypothetical protein [Syntrophales bacterium]HQN79135.1 hypothetical protein [Syntrophales bacterium]HQQ28331.1 hypothetical protein [Syntrophales bacterium]